ncbi:uncharacterized protein F5891DRAFT_991492 [Suillus fuscotomentosus]|uniref:Uncharacterized protein n=1 Tax=Suillus fuscotomentosus TaxID=1912939 RepID=A0AAD4HAK0_9AGAM|nr:uncharacterized protein F5891DRAFT_991492 [Suillus fuscotomentosus]KAG1879942.1 hypothetical protein F5891DRAFT_991492 [Suillus fuscotomentosus]
MVVKEGQIFLRHQNYTVCTVEPGKEDPHYMPLLDLSQWHVRNYACNRAWVRSQYMCVIDAGVPEIEAWNTYNCHQGKGQEVVGIVRGMIRVMDYGISLNKLHLCASFSLKALCQVSATACTVAYQPLHQTRCGRVGDLESTLRLWSRTIHQWIVILTRGSQWVEAIASRPFMFWTLDQMNQVVDQLASIEDLAENDSIEETGVVFCCGHPTVLTYVALHVLQCQQLSSPRFSDDHGSVRVAVYTSWKLTFGQVPHKRWILMLHNRWEYPRAIQTLGDDHVCRKLCLAT